MILHKPAVIHQDDYSILWVKMEMENPRVDLPEYLWIRVPSAYGEYFTCQCDPFLPSALLAGMYYGEEIHVRGAVSPSLAYRLNEYQFLLSIRFPDVLHTVDINFELIESPQVSPKAVGALFSGGVDSLFTLWEHLPDNQENPDYQITHGVFIKGFDLLHDEKDDYLFLYQRYSEELKKLNLDLIPMDTNLISIPHTRMPLPFYFGPSLLGAGLSLAGLFRIFYIPSSWDYHKLQKESYSSDPELDSMLSTETLRIIHHGSTHLRVEKVEEIANWDLAHELLWVCIGYEFKDHTWNCSRCEKCFRTMIPLYAMDMLDDYKTFERPIRSNHEILWWIRKFSLRQNYVSQMFPFVRKHKPGLIPWMLIAGLLGVIRYWLVEFMPNPIKKWLRRFGYYVTRNEAPDAYELPAVTLAIREAIDREIS